MTRMADKNMKKLITATGVLTLLLNSAVATLYTWQPADPDLDDLDHHNAYKWGIKSTSLQSELAGGWTIQSARLTIYNIYDWTANEKDMLFVHLLDSPGTTSWVKISNDNPNDNIFNDYFAAYPLIRVDAAFDYAIGAPDYASSTDGIYQDPDGPLTKETITYTFSPGLLATLTSYVLNDGIFGIGFDPDCHYYNDKIQLTVSTERRSVPDGGVTIALLGLGLCGLGSLRRKLS